MYDLRSFLVTYCPDLLLAIVELPDGQSLLNEATEGVHYDIQVLAEKAKTLFDELDAEFRPNDFWHRIALQSMSYFKTKTVDEKWLVK